MPLYALTVFTGAFLLFQVQPLIGKFILPWFGGSPGVWTACLLFFQSLLLGGYAYAHVLTTWVRPARQGVVHLVLLLLALVFVPIVPAEAWKPGPAEDPTGRILLLLGATLGLPYFILSATGPLLQRWFSQTHAGVSPYRLYALSNAGSLLALLTYPFVFEPAFTRHTQAWLWSAGLVFFVIVCGWCAWRVRRQALAAPESFATGAEAGPAPRPAASDQVLWVALPAVASVLLLAVTNKLCQDIAVIPFLWVVPLAIYLISFILCFDHPRWYRRGFFAALMTLAIGVVCYLLFAGNSASIEQQVAGYTVLLLSACMVCHGELYRLKPAPLHLTRYFLLIATGGALGGLFVGVVAPYVFDQYLELHVGLWALAYLTGVVAMMQRSRALVFAPMIGLVLVALVVPALQVEFATDWRDWFRLFGRELEIFYLNYGTEALGLLIVFFLCAGDWRRGWAREWRARQAGFTLLLSFGLGIVLVIQASKQDADALAGGRNFYGTLHVFEYNTHEPRTHYHLLRHGGTTHGLQFTALPQATWPTSYYAESSGLGLAVRQLPAEQPRHIGVVGLGTGTMAAYGREGDRLRFYDINPAVERIAREHFTYLENTPAAVDIVLGDARLSMEEELARGEPQAFDLLALDAFSSDAIPVHLLTREALQVYLGHLAPDGVIAVHISNRYLDLRPVVQLLAQDAGLHLAVIQDDPGDEWWSYRTSWILLTRRPEFLAAEPIADVTDDPKPVDPAVSLWTDEFASLFPILH